MQPSRPAHQWSHAAWEKIDKYDHAQASSATKEYTAVLRGVEAK